LPDHRLDREAELRDDESQRQRLLRAVEQLPTELREMLLLKFAGRTHLEIGERYGVSKSGVTRRLQAAQKSLEEELVHVA